MGYSSWKDFEKGVAHESIVEAIESRPNLKANLDRLKIGRFDFVDARALLSACTRLIIELERRGDKQDIAPIINTLNDIITDACKKGLTEEYYNLIHRTFMGKMECDK